MQKSYLDVIAQGHALWRGVAPIRIREEQIRGYGCDSCFIRRGDRLGVLKKSYAGFWSVLKMRIQSCKCSLERQDVHRFRFSAGAGTDLILKSCNVEMEP
jgi:hypothetical protein